MATKTKKFDCVAMKQRGAEEILKALDGLTIEDELAFWHNAHLQTKSELRIVRESVSEYSPGKAK